jgi:hypothetical protein
LSDPYPILSDTFSVSVDLPAFLVRFSAIGISFSLRSCAVGHYFAHLLLYHRSLLGSYFFSVTVAALST